VGRLRKWCIGRAWERWEGSWSDSRGQRAVDREENQWVDTGSSRKADRAAGCGGLLIGGSNWTYSKIFSSYEYLGGGICVKAKD